MSGDIGTPSKPVVFRGQEWRLEVREDDPADPADDERWLRSDLVDQDADQLGVLKCGDGTEIPIFETGTAEETVSEAMRVQIGGEIGYLPIAPVEDAQYRSRRVQHNNEIHAYHNAVSPGAAIPDSAIHRWILDDVNGTVEDSIGNLDATNNGVASVSGDWIGGSAGEGDGVGDNINVGNLDISDLLDSGFTIAYTVQASSSSDDAMPMSVREADDSTAINIVLSQEFFNSTNTIGFGVHDDNDNSVFVRGPDNIIDDAEPHRCVIAVGDATDDSTFDFFHQASSVSTTTERDQGLSTFGAMHSDYHMFCRNDQGTLERFLPGILNDFIIFDEKLTSGQIQDDYDRQPWS